MKLTEHRWVHAIWWHDIRQEVGNKPSFMGVYTGSLVVPSLPAVLPRLAVWVNVWTPKAQRFKTLNVRICNNEDEKPLAAIEVDSEALAGATTQGQSLEPSEGKNAAGEPSALGMSFILLLGQLPLKETTRWLKVWVDTESEVLESFKLRIDTPATVKSAG
jgi:hypothetical protein